MRDYMPGPHRRFLERLASVANIRPFVDAHRDNQDLCDSFDSCLAMLRGFRDKHIQIVSRYIIIQAKNAKKINTDAAKVTRNVFSIPDNVTPTASAQKSNLASTGATKNGLTGTGGTALIPFLKQARDETGEPAMSPIAKRLLLRSPGTKSPAIYSNANVAAELGAVFSNPDAPAPMVGLAGYWFSSNEFGGLCSY